MPELNTKMLSIERQNDILRRLKIEFRGILMGKCNLLTRAILEIRFRKLLKSRTLLEYMQERKRLHEQGIYFGTLEEELTIPFVGLTKEELYTMGLDNKRIDNCYRLNYEEIFIMPSIIGKENYEKIHSYRDSINKFAN